MKPGKTKIIWAETPSNPLWQVFDLTALVEIAHGARARLAVDSTCATPILTQPVMPTACGKLLDILGIPAEKRSFAELGGGARIVGGSELPAPTAIFPRYVDPEAEAK